jgi:uncharacterized membrane protein
MEVINTQDLAEPKTRSSTSNNGENSGLVTSNTFSAFHCIIYPLTLQRMRKNAKSVAAEGSGQEKKN